VIKARATESRKHREVLNWLPSIVQTVPVPKGRRDFCCDLSDVVRQPPEGGCGEVAKRLYSIAQEHVGLLLRSSDTEQPRALALGRAVRKKCPASGTRFFGHAAGIIGEQPKDALGRPREAHRSRPRPREGLLLGVRAEILSMCPRRIAPRIWGVGDAFRADSRHD
jgi:hypothetical protein